MKDYVKTYEYARKVADTGLQRYMTKVYAHVAGALLLTTLAATATLTYSPLAHLIFYTKLGYVAMFAPIGIAMYVSTKHNFYHMSLVRSRFLLGMGALCIGMSLASLALYYTAVSLHKTFLVTTVTFGGMSIYGYTTNRDLSAAHSFCIMAIWGLFISAIVNFFLQSDVIDFVASMIGVIVFTLHIAYHTQRLKELYYEIQDSNVANKAALIGAYTLYISFLNLFSYLLRFLGESRRRN